MLFNCKITKKNELKFQGDSIRLVKQDPNTRLLGVGSSNGILRIVNCYDEIPQVFNKSIHYLPITSLDWLANGSICLSVDSSEIMLYDPLKDCISHFPTHTNSDIRGLRSISVFEILVWFRDGTTILVDIRDKFRSTTNNNNGNNINNSITNITNITNTNSTMRIKTKQTTTCANINKQNQNIIYTTTVPGTVLNIWDRRYTSRGNFVCSSKQILNTHTTDFEFIDGSLILTDNLSNIYKISETGNFICKLVESHTQGEFSTVCTNLKYDCIFIGGSNGVYSFSKSIVKLLDGPFLGCASSSEKLFVYSDEKIYEYKIIPYLTMNK